MRGPAPPTAVVWAVMVALLGACRAGDAGTGGATAIEPEHRAAAADPVLGAEAARETPADVTTPAAGSNPAPRPGLPCAREPDPPADAPPLSLRRVPSDADPLRVAVYGDSLAITFEPSVEEALATLGGLGIPAVVGPPAAAPGFGFTSSGPGYQDGQRVEGFAAFAGWRESLERFVSEHDPDLFVVLLGSWDDLDREVGDRLLYPGACGWHEWYSGLVDEAVERFTANGARVVWLSRPCSQLPTDPRRPSLNAAYADAAARYPGTVAYVDLDAYVCPAGRVVTETRVPDGSIHRVREPDGNHFTWAEAAPVLGPWLAGELRRVVAF